MIEFCIDEPEDDAFHDYCGVVGVLVDKIGLTPEELHSLHVRWYFATRALSHRGGKGVGFLARFYGQETCTSLFLDGSAPKLRPSSLDALAGTLLLSHTRYPTVGSTQPYNYQPLQFSSCYGEIAVVHNGQMTNMLALKDELRRKYGAPLGDSHSDTWVIPYLIHYSGASTLEQAIRYAASRLEGAFSLIIQSATKTWALRDRFGIRPLFYGKNPELGVTVTASETCTHEVFRIPGEECVRVRPGEMVTFEPGREPIHQLLLTRPPGVPSAFCGFEASYFARPDSIDPVMLKRYAVFRDVVGEMLAEQDIARDPTFRPDVVIAVPNSGIDFAQGYANRLGCPFRMALKRNQTEAGADRSFIAPTQEERAKLVKYKYILIPEWVRGKKVVMVDDSKVRGTTHIVLVERLFKAGATEVHTRLGYPMIKYYCYFAIDIATQKELVAHGRTLEEIAAFGGETSVDYITEENFLQAYGRVRGVPFEGQAPLCRGCVSGIYPCPRQDDSTEVLAGRAR